MAKRGAGTELTDRNWDQDEEPEEAGVFSQADEGTLKNRQIRKAKRRNANEGGSASSGAFKNFAGFTTLTKKPEGTAAPTFNFGLGPSKPLDIANGASPKSSTGATGFQFNTKSPEKCSETKDSSNGEAKKEDTNRSKYLQQLKCLNEGVAKWIKDHVDKNPFIVLTPIFRDYEKYLADLDKKYPESAEKKGTSSSNGSGKISEDTELGNKKSSSASSTPPKYTFGLTAASSSSTKPISTTTNTEPVFGTGSTGSGFSFSSTDKSATSGFTFGSISTSSTGTTLGGNFSFKSDVAASTKGFGSGGFSFATGSNPGTASNADTKGEGEDEEYVPPKPEASAVVEDDAIYTKRCKLFYQREGAWVEKGLGNLHLKPCGEKTQLLIRADTTLGNILLNIMLNPSLPMKRQGKNNVSLICIPNPPIDPKMEEKKPVSMLLRVKTAEDADELLEKLEENKGEK